MTIRTRLTLWYSSLLATVIVVFAISLFILLNWAWQSQVRENMEYAARQAYSIDASTGQLQVHIPEGEDLIPYPFGIQVRDAAGQLLGTSNSLSKYTTRLDNTALIVTEPVMHEVNWANNHSLVLTMPIVAK